MSSPSRSAKRFFTEHRSARRIASVYLLVGLAWITGSDELVVRASSGLISHWLNLGKGYAYVVITAVLLYVAVARLQERTRAAGELVARSEQAYRAMFESNPSPMWVFEPASLRILAVNDAAADFYGYSREQLLAMSLSQLHPPGAEAELAQLAALEGDTPSHHLPVRQLSGGRRTLLVELTTHVIPFHGRAARLALVRDLTETLQTRCALEASQLLLQEAQRIAGIGSWRRDPLSGATHYSPELLQIYGREPLSHTGPADLAEQIHADDSDRVRLAYECARDGAPLDIEYRIWRTDGRLRHLAERGERVDGSAGPQIVGVVMDISARKQAEQRLAESERQYRALVELMPDAVVVHDGERILFANPAALRLAGAVRLSELTGQPVARFIAPASREDHGARLRAFRRRDPRFDTDFQPRQLTRLDGKVIDVELAAQPIEHRGGRALQVVIRDVGVQRRLQAETLARVHALVRQLRPARLDDEGLAAAIEAQLQLLPGEGPPHCHFDAAPLLPRPEPAVEMALFHIFQEALANVLNHAGAHHLSVTLQRRGDSLELRVVDDGCGFDTAAPDPGAGLAAMRARAQLLGGELQLRSLPGTGTDLVVSVPEHPG